MNVQNWSDIATPRFSYVDESLSVNASRTKFEQGFIFNQATGLQQLNGQSINSYNSLYLTSRHLTSDIFTFNQIESELQTITTSLRFIDQDTNSYKYLKFVEGGYELIDTESNDTRFQIKILSDRLLTIKHITNNIDYRLCLTSGAVYFDVETGNDSLWSLKYLVDSDGYLILYSNTTPNYILTYSAGALSMVEVTPGDTIRGSDNLINIEYNFTNLDYNINSSWVSYDRENLNLAAITDERSAYNLLNQYLITTSYNTVSDSVDVNFINLKNNISEGNYVKRGSHINTAPQNTPTVDFRFYSSINSGLNQERGNENIVLSYVFYDKDIVARPGTDTFFTTTSSIHPYAKLNINDSKFVANGAYGSFAPHVSDNIQKLRVNTTDFNNGRYLCTWLSGNSMGNQFQWVDRYYYPDITSKEAAYSGNPLYNPSFADPIDDVAYSLAYKQIIQRSPIFDKKSDLYLEPNTRYIYKRVSTDDFAAHVNTLSSYQIYTDRNEYVFDGANSFAVPVSAINNTGQFTVSFDMYLKPGVTYGYGILGNLTNYGFSVLNDTFVTPTMFTFKDNTLYIYNTEQVLISQQTFDRNIKDVIRFDGMDNYVVVCEDGYVYRLTYNNTIEYLLQDNLFDSYNGFEQTENKIAFLANSTGDVVVLDTNTMLTSLSTAQAVQSGSLNSVYFAGSALKAIPGTNLKRYDANTVCYQESNTIYKLDITTDIETPVIQSSSLLTDYAIDAYGNFLFIHNRDKFSLYNKNRVKVFTQTLSAIPLSGSKCEFVRQHAFGATEELISIAGIDDTGKTQLTLWDYSGVMRSSDTVLGSLSATQSNFTNYNRYIGTDFTDTLRFKLVLKNLRNKADITSETITYDFGSNSEGYVTLSYVFDSVRGLITLLVNGIAQETIHIEPGKYTLNDLFDDNFQIGTTGFFNGSTLPEYLAQPDYYGTANTKIRNLFIYSSPLRAGDVTALSLVDTEVDDLVLSIPCGQRNNIEEITRYFKFGVPGSASNHIKIEVKNSGITNTALQDTIKTNILQNLPKYMKGDVQVDDITFVDYSPLQ